ncbi:hypothetical protein RND81_01G109200 [Saponaria officinalis]|uniref:Uncharacterized protein n=1 Tax=Saponaria officinalis TaxID=3572 RepID=A0AAW1N6S0_SAPOF
MFSVYMYVRFSVYVYVRLVYVKCICLSVILEAHDISLNTPLPSSFFIRSKPDLNTQPFSFLSRQTQPNHHQYLCSLRSRCRSQLQCRPPPPPFSPLLFISAPLLPPIIESAPPPFPPCTTASLLRHLCSFLSKILPPDLLYSVLVLNR